LNLKFPVACNRHRFLPLDGGVKVKIPRSLLREGLLMRKSTLFFLSLAVLSVLLVGVFTHAAYQRGRDASDVGETAAMVKRLDLTDLCLFTEARYTRHPTQADLHSPFQDHPMSLEHFPSGSLLAPRKDIGGR